MPEKKEQKSRGPQRQHPLQLLAESWGAVVSVLTISAFVVSSYIYIDNRYFEKAEAVVMEERLAGTAADKARSVQMEILSIRLDQYRWELRDINLRIKDGSTIPGDMARKIQLEEQIKAIIQSIERLKDIP